MSERGDVSADAAPQWSFEDSHVGRFDGAKSPVQPFCSQWVGGFRGEGEGVGANNNNNNQPLNIDQTTNQKQLLLDESFLKVPIEAHMDFFSFPYIVVAMTFLPVYCIFSHIQLCSIGEMEVFCYFSVSKNRTSHF